MSVELSAYIVDADDADAISTVIIFYGADEEEAEAAMQKHISHSDALKSAEREGRVITESEAIDDDDVPTPADFEDEEEGDGEGEEDDEE